MLVSTYAAAAMLRIEYVLITHGQWPRHVVDALLFARAGVR